MNNSLTKWLMTGALGAGFIVGCNHSSSSRVSKDTRPTAPAVAQNPPCIYGVIYPLDGVQSAPASAGSGSVTPSAATLPPITVNTPTVNTPDPRLTMPPPIIIPSPPAPPPPVCTTTPPPPPVVSTPVKAPDVVRIQNTSPSPEHTHSKPESTLGHADDYGWLCGTISHDFKKPSAWRLRYLSIDQTDDFGGALTLVEDESLRDLKEGMQVKVWGRVREADRPCATPAYFVDRVTVLSK
jgi:hypothetical protein